MLRKILSFTTVLALFVTTTFITSAASTGDYIGSYTVKPTEINPVEGEVSDIFLYNKDLGYFSVDVLDSEGEIVEHIYDNYFIAKQKTHLEWDGKITLNSGIRTFAPDGEYEVRVLTRFAKNSRPVLDEASQTVTVDTTDEEDEPRLFNFQIDPSTFESNGDDYTEISFNTDQATYITVEVETEYGRTVKTFSNYDGDRLISAGSHLMRWYGDSNEGKYLDGDFKVSVFVENSNGSEDALGNVTVTEEEDEEEEVAPKIENLYAIPIYFEAGSESTDITFDLVGEAELDVEIKQGNTLVKQFVSPYDGTVMFDGGSHSLVWSGVGNDGEEVDEGTYTVYVTANNGLLEDEAHTSFYVSNEEEEASKPDVTNLDTNPNVFEAIEDDTLISFDTDQEAELTVEIENSNGRVVKTFSTYDGDTKSAGSHSVTWNGTDDSYDAITEGLYTVNVTASNSNGADTDSVAVYVKETTVTPEPTDLEITDLTASPSTFDPSDDDVEIKFYLTEDADNVEVSIKDGTTVVRELKDSSEDKGWVTLDWNAKDDDGDLVDDDTYTVYVRAENEDGYDTATTTVKADSDNVSSDGIIKNFEISPSSTWDPSDDDELEIEFDLTDDVDRLEIYAEDEDGRTVEILDERDVDEDDYNEEWDGYDDDDDLVEEGTWTIYVEADGDMVYDTVEVDYEDPEFDEIFLTKDSFDPSIDETTHLVFKLTEDAVVTVKVYDDDDRLETLMDDEDLEKNVWYAVEWDGTEDGDEVDEGSYHFELVAEHPEDDDIEVEAKKYVSIDEEDYSSSRANVTEDYTDPVIFDEDEDSYITFSYCIDEDAEVTIGIYDNTSASGSADFELIDELDQDQGCHTVKWDGTDDRDRSLSEDIYSYKITSDYNGRTSTEKGRFVISDNKGSDDDDDDDDRPKATECERLYWDVNSVDNEMCEAITWATNEGIFDGYDDGSFKPYRLIDRAETLKVILEAFEDEVTMLPANGTTLGFVDIDPNAWYMPYVRTAKFYGMLHGYVNSTEARLYKNINRVEFLKLALEASDAFTDYEIPGYEVTYFEDVEDLYPESVWYFDYAGASYTYGLFNTYYDAGTNKTYLRPGQEVQRGEVALVLYRMYLNGLLD